MISGDTSPNIVLSMPSKPQPSPLAKAMCQCVLVISVPLGDGAIIRIPEMFLLERSELRANQVYGCVAHGYLPEDPYRDTTRPGRSGVKWEDGACDARRVVTTRRPANP